MKIHFVLLIFSYLSYWVESVDIPVLTDLQNVAQFADEIKADDSIAMDKYNNILQLIKKLDTSLFMLLLPIVNGLPDDSDINSHISDLEHGMDQIEIMYESLWLYSDNTSNSNDDSLKSFVSKIITRGRNNVPNTLEEMFEIILPADSQHYDVGLLDDLEKVKESLNPLETCNPEISYQNRLLQMYYLITITEIRAFMMTSFAYKTGEGSSGYKIEQARRIFMRRLDGYLQQFRRYMVDASREIFLCDPASLTDNETYIELEGLFTAYVINEYETNLDYDYPCWQTCRDITIWGHYRCYDIIWPKYCPKHPCKGLVYDCGWIGGDVDICEYPGEALKRYDYVRSYTNGWYGKWTNCPSPATYQQVNGRLNRGYSCDMCMCRCEESYGSSKAIRTFSLREQVTNIDENKVVSDVKFVLKDKMVHIQIEESPLQPLGFLDRNQSSWVPLEDFIYLSNVTDGAWVQVKDGQYIPMIRDTDFAFIRRDQRKLNLDEISGGPNMVLTGLRLRHESEEYTGDESAGNVSPLQLEIRVTPFNYTSGELMLTEDNPSVWITPLTQPKLPSEYAENRKELEIGDYAYRWESAPSPPNLKPNQYVEFRQSSIHSDVGQSTMPFMDSRPVAPTSPIAFDGLGIAYRGDKKFGGFIILKPMTIDFTNYIDDD